MSVIAQAGGMKHKTGRELILTDFFSLSYDTVENATPTLSDAEVLEKVKTRFKKYLKK